MVSRGPRDVIKPRQKEARAMMRRATGLTLVLDLAVLGAVLLGSATVLEPAAAAKKPEDRNAFVVTAALKQYIWTAGGSFKATGAIADAGPATGGPGVPPDELVLYGEQGSIRISLDEPDYFEFTIDGGTDAYSELAGGGTYTVEVNWKKPGKPQDLAATATRQKASSTLATWRYRLEGTVRQ
jgi:hypothetical protein